MEVSYLQMKGVTKQFPGVLALDNVDIYINQGEVLGLVGENGAGKSTLMKILTGVYKKDQGEILVNGKKVDIQKPLDAQKLGISIIHQELNVLLNLDIAENIFIGKEKRNGIFVDKTAMHAEARKLLDMVGLDVDTTTLLQDLSIGQRQMVEVARALSFDSKIIVMDEPTSSLTESETKILLDIILKLKSEGVGVVFISHRLNEIFQICDRVTVMRDGQMVGNLIGQDISEKNVVGLMVGREINNMFEKEETNIGDVVLEVKHLSTKGFLKDINFKLRKGEILGFAGLVGAGRTEVMRAIFGVDKKEAGEIYVRGEKININSAEDAIRHGMGFVPEDRKGQGLILGMTVKENITLPYLESISRHKFIDQDAEGKIAEDYVDKLDIKTPSIEQKAMNLSGGNQQKVVISKWLATNPEILILDEPTRGIDVGAKKEIHRLMSKLAKTGVAIIMISSEMPEILGMSDRIMVMHEGCKKGELSRQEASQNKIMQMAIAQNQ
ncbi:MAG: sugar ABC transporter ATP-binding protein [Clostridia bacterium]|nr:sugar ABC transporter ATP-binding protein [Clostridia bacterium]